MSALEGADVPGDVQDPHRPHGRQGRGLVQAPLRARPEEDREDNLDLRVVPPHGALDDGVRVGHAPAQIQREVLDARCFQLLRKVARRPYWHRLVVVPVEKVDRRKERYRCLFVLVPLLRVQQPLGRTTRQVMLRHVVHDLRVKPARRQMGREFDQVVRAGNAQVRLEVLDRKFVHALGRLAPDAPVGAAALRGLHEAMLQQQRCAEVGAGALAHEHHVAHVPAVDLDVLEDPPHAAADVLHHVRYDASREIPIVDPHGDHTEIHQPQAQLRVVAPVPDNEGAAHHRDHDWHLRPLTTLGQESLLGHVDV
mmetsp:Transcript_33554/g.101300  ORF Transcript_33554/g.101300 Transcript_33554/m.101300 type:complete len:310 (-) Transcript_33554:323-1252(-)